MSNLHPELARQLLVGSLARIKKINPTYHAFVIRELEARDPSGGWASLGGLADIFSNIGDNLSTVLQDATQKYGDILVSRENAKTAGILANEQVKAQIAQMNAQLKLKQAESQSAFLNSQLQAQQNELYNTGASFGSGNLLPWIIAGVAGLFILTKRAA